MESQASRLQVQTDNDRTAWRRTEPVRLGESCGPRRPRPLHVMAPGRRRRGGKRVGKRGGALASAACGDPLVGVRLEVEFGERAAEEMALCRQVSPARQWRRGG